MASMSSALTPPRGERLHALHLRPRRAQGADRAFRLLRACRTCGRKSRSSRARGVERRDVLPIPHALERPSLCAAGAAMVRTLFRQRGQSPAMLRIALIDIVLFALPFLIYAGYML